MNRHAGNSPVALDDPCKKIKVNDVLWECIESRECVYRYSYGGDVFCKHPSASKAAIYLRPSAPVRQYDPEKFFNADDNSSLPPVVSAKHD